MHFDNRRSFIEKLSLNQHVLFTSDVNLGSMAWNNIRSSNLPFAADSDFELLLLEFLSQHNLYQINNILNDKNRLLDLIPIECIFKKSIHHNPIVIDLGIIEFYNCRLRKIDVFTLDFKKANFIGLNNLDWTSLLSNMDNVRTIFKYSSQCNESFYTAEKCT